MGLGLEKYKNAFSGEQETAWRDLSDAIDKLAAHIGVPDMGFIDTVSPTYQSNPKLTPPVPAAAQFAVVGQDGKFTIYIVNPENTVALSPAIASLMAGGFGRGVLHLPALNPQGRDIVHNLQSCTTIDFDAAHNLTDYGISPQLVHHYQNPNVTLFWRLRSSFDKKNWNKWQIYGNATIACGPLGVYSGLLRTAALAQADAAYTPTTQPLTAVTGGSPNHATIQVASFQVQYPFGLRTYNSGSITPLLDSTGYYVYCLDPTYAGGALAYVATQNNPDLTTLDSVVWLGSVTTPAFGGGNKGGGGGGSGPCFTGNTRVIAKTGIKPIQWVRVGDEILTQRGWRRVKRVLEHKYAGPLQDMGEEEFVTPEHHFWHSPAWRPGREIFPLVIEHFVGSVFNLEVEGDGSDLEQCYVLANGRIAHNQIKPVQL